MQTFLQLFPKYFSTRKIVRKWGFLFDISQGLEHPLALLIEFWVDLFIEDFAGKGVELGLEGTGGLGDLWARGRWACWKIFRFVPPGRSNRLAP
jgi:hypothetical protein